MRDRWKKGKEWGKGKEGKRVGVERKMSEKGRTNVSIHDWDLTGPMAIIQHPQPYVPLDDLMTEAQKQKAKLWRMSPLTAVEHNSHGCNLLLRTSLTL